MTEDQRKALDEAVKELNAMDENSDAEIEHGNAEQILCNLLIELGCEEASDAFDNANVRVGFWYA